MEIDNVALSSFRVGLGTRRPAVLGNKGGVDVVKGVGPDLTNACINKVVRQKLHIATT